MILTERQAQVAALAQSGASIKEIAIALDLAENTVKTHKKAISAMSKKLNRDVFGMPVSRNERLAAFQKIIKRVNAHYKFGTDKVLPKTVANATL